MFNIVELAADENEQKDAPCKWGNIVVNHACYCHADHWNGKPRKCPIYRNFRDEPSKWFTKPAAFDADPYVGGCPMFEAVSPVQPGDKVAKS